MMYGTGADTLRCLALATVDDPIPTAKMNLQEPTTFCEYEVNVHYNTVNILECSNNTFRFFSLLNFISEIEDEFTS